MALPESTPGPEDTHDSEPRPGRPPAPERPDWLVGPEEGVRSERERRDAAPESPRLHRPLPPGDEPQGTRAEPLAPPLLSRPDAPPGRPLASRAAAAEPKQPRAWAAAGSSVPRLTQRPEPPERPAVPAEEIPGLADEAEPGGALLSTGDAEGVPSPAPPPLVEPWWIVIGERLAADRRLQAVLAGALAVAIGAWILWPRAGTGLSIRQVRENAAAWEGRQVRINGRVGEVFEIGQGVVFNLHDGRDTIVVFSRTRAPVPRKRVEVVGTVSTGYLDGRPRVAILERTGP